MLNRYQKYINHYSYYSSNNRGIRNKELENKIFGKFETRLKGFLLFMFYKVYSGTSFIKNKVLFR